MKILLVEDYDEIRDMLKSILESYGHYVIAASGRKGAEMILCSCKFDVVITDKDLPNEDEGIMLLGLARKENPDAVILLVSGNAHGCNSDMIIDTYKINGVLSKPIDAKKLLARVKEEFEKMSQTATF